jgi:uncharacterized DUF497 family protein
VKTIFGAPFEFGWNPAKAASNPEKHNVSFEMVEQFEFGTCVTTEDNRQDYDEDRYIALGFIGERLHVLVFTMRHMNREVGTFWVISLRKANRREIDRYVRQTEE